jgi:CheY-like chemotaxis protein
MKILVIEDDPKTGDYLKKGLRESGYTVDLARTGTDGLRMALENAYWYWTSCCPESTAGRSCQRFVKNPICECCS